LKLEGQWYPKLVVVISNVNKSKFASSGDSGSVYYIARDSLMYPLYPIAYHRISLWHKLPDENEQMVAFGSRLLIGLEILAKKLDIGIDNFSLCSSCCKKGHLDISTIVSTQDKLQKSVEEVILEGDENIVYQPNLS